MLDDGALVDVSGQRHLDEDSMHHRVIVKPIDRGQQLSLGRLGGKAKDGAIHSGRRAGFLLTSDIDAAGRVITDEDDTQARDHGGTRGELLDLRRDLTANLLRQHFSIDDLSSHGVPLLGGEVLSAGKGIFPDSRTFFKGTDDGLRRKARGPWLRDWQTGGKPRRIYSGAPARGCLKAPSLVHGFVSS